MHLSVIGLNHKTTPIEVREKVTFSSSCLSTSLASLLADPVIEEGVILSTCNRTELYVVSCYPLAKIADALYCFLGQGNLAVAELMRYCYGYEQDEAVRHLMHVVCGLDSMVLGESQIAGQVRTAFQASQKMGGTDTWLNPLFNRALHASGRARSETQIGERPVSISHAAVTLARKIFGEQLGEHQVMMVGAGKMSELAAKLLQKLGARSIFVANRSMERAQKFAELLGGEVISFSQVPDRLCDVDVVITSTSAPHPVITYDCVKLAMANREGRPLFLIDIAVPRDVEPKVGTLDHVFLYDIDDLKTVVSENIKDREREVSKVEKIIQEESQRFWKWYLSRSALQLVTDLGDVSEEVRRAAITHLFKQVPPLNEKEKQAFEQFSQQLIASR